MAYDDYEIHHQVDPAPVAVKILIAGGFGVGKTTLVSSLTEISPLRTEEDLTSAGTVIDSVAGVDGKRTTTVAMDFGRITIHAGLVLYLFGMPGQERFWFMWDDLSYGSLGAVIMADTRRLADCFPAIDYFEHRGTPFVVALNHFDGARPHELSDIRGALDLDAHVPIMACDARERATCQDALVTLVEHAATLLAPAARRPESEPTAAVRNLRG